jgi:hypothetical protein
MIEAIATSLRLIEDIVTNSALTVLIKTVVLRINK